MNPLHPLGLIKLLCGSMEYIFVRLLIQLVREILFLDNCEGSSITRKGSGLLGLLLLGTRRSFALEGGLGGSRLQRKFELLVPGSGW